MYVEIQDKGGLKFFMDRAVTVVGSERKLSSAVGMANSMVHYYKHKAKWIPLERFKKMCELTGISEEKISFRLVEKKEWLSKGGRNGYLKKVKEGRALENLEKMRKASSKELRKWHKEMKENHPKKYYEIQYNRFKKISEYKFITKKGEKVRNIYEKEIADYLYSLNINYKYEPFVEGKNKPYFPDFLVDKIVIESTAWRGFDKAESLSKKIKDLEEAGYKVVVIVPEKVKKYYSSINKYLIKVEGIKDYIEALVA